MRVTNPPAPSLASIDSSQKLVDGVLEGLKTLAPSLAAVVAPLESAFDAGFAAERAALRAPPTSAPSQQVPTPVPSVPRSGTTGAPPTSSSAAQVASGFTAPAVDLKRGDRGASVLQLQKDLVHLGFLSQADLNTGPGIYGPHTQAAVARLQAKYGIPGNAGVNYGPKTRAALQKALGGAAPAPAPSPKPPSSSGGDPRVVQTAEQFWKNGHVNPNTGTKEWSGWCLGFVHQAHLVATGHDDPQLRAGTAAQAMNQMKAAGRLRTDWSNLKPGAAIFWGSQAGAAGHVCLFTGRFDAHGSPICVTTGNWIGANHGVIEEPLSAIERYDGKASGWAQLN